MLFFTCASDEYVELIPLYKFCVNRAYPDAKVIVLETEKPSMDRFLLEQEDDYVHVTDIDMLILPKEISHEEYYKSEMVNGCSYLRGATFTNGQAWEGDFSRICGGQVSFTQEYYDKTKDIRNFFKTQRKTYREFDEVMLYNILKSCDYPIPENPYTFPSGNSWNKDYRDVHINDFWGIKYLKWEPNREQIGDLVVEKQFQTLCKDLSSRWLPLINKIIAYSV